MKGYISNIEQLALDNENFRSVLYTDEKVQLVVMSLLPNEDIGEEVHEDLDQFIRVEAGEGYAVLGGEQREIVDGSVVIVPAGITHNIVNASSVKPMKLYTLYSPPQHHAGTTHKTKEDAMKDEEHFEGMVG